MLKKLAVGIAVGLAATSAQASDWLHCGQFLTANQGNLLVSAILKLKTVILNR